MGKSMKEGSKREEKSESAAKERKEVASGKSKGKK